MGAVVTRAPAQNWEFANGKAVASTTRVVSHLAVAVGLTSGGPARSGEAAIKIGVMADMNGPLSTASGPGSLEAARMAAEEFG